MKSKFRPPAALADPLGFRSVLIDLLPPSIVFYTRSGLGGAQNSNSGRVRAQILETLHKLRSPGSQNSNSRRIRAQILETLYKLRSPGTQNSNSGYLRAQTLETLCK